MFRAIIVASIALFFQSAYSQDYVPFNAEQLKVLVPSSTRYVTSLSGEWERSEEGSEWTVVKLPRSETSYGKITYRRQLKIDSQMVQRYMWNLYFLGLSDAAEISINDQIVGRYFGGMVPFMVRIPDKYIRAGNNILQLSVIPASTEALRSRQLQLFGQRVYTGFVREILLVGTPQVAFGDVKTTVQLAANEARLKINTTLISGAIDRITLDSSQKILLSASQLNISAELKRESGEVVASSTQSVSVSRDRRIDLSTELRVSSPSLWNYNNPVLYQLVVKVSSGSSLIDELSLPQGLVNFEEGNYSSQSLLSVNGEGLFVKAIDYTEEVAHNGATVSAQQFEKDIQLMKTLGVNCVHVRYLPPHPYFMYLCSRYGLPVIIDLPAAGLPWKVVGSEELMRRVRNVAELMVSAYERYPACAAWNIAEGLEQDKPQTYSYLKTFADFLHSTSSRPVAQSVLFRSPSVVSDNIDMLFFVADRYNLAPDAVYRELTRLSQLSSKPFALSFGKPIQPDNRNGYADPLSVEAQARYIQTCYKALRDAKAGGSDVWALCDYTLNHSTMLTNTAGHNYCYAGIADIERQPRVSFAMYKSLLNDEKDPLLQAGAYAQTSPLIFILGGIVLILAFVFMLNRSRRFREYVLRALIHPYNFYADIRDQRILSNAQTVTLAAMISATIAIMLTTLLYYSRMHADAEYFVMLLFPQESVKEFVSRIAWNPELCFVVISFVVLTALILLSLVLRIAAMFIRGRIFFSDTFIITVWSSLPLLLFLPFATILYRVLDFTSVSVWLVLAIVAKMWALFRIMRATSVVYDVRALPVYGIGIGLVLLVISSAAFIYNTAYSFFAYLGYFFSIVL